MQHTAGGGGDVKKFSAESSLCLYSVRWRGFACALHVFRVKIGTIDSCWRIWMEEPRKQENKSAADNLGEMFEALGSAMGQIFNDPKLKEKARDLGKAAKESAETMGERFKDEEVHAKFREVGKAAQAFGKNIVDIFAEGKNKTDSGGQKED